MGTKRQSKLETARRGSNSFSDSNHNNKSTTSTWEQRLTTYALWAVGALILILGCQQHQLVHMMFQYEDAWIASPLQSSGGQQHHHYLSVRSKKVWKALHNQRSRITPTQMPRKKLPRRIRKEGELKYLLFITTLFSQGHQKAFRDCWPTLMNSSRLLRNADIVVFASNHSVVQDESIMNFVEHELFGTNPSFTYKFPSVSTLLDINRPSNRGDTLANNANNVAQLGATEAMHQGVVQGLFANYSWVIRIHPDVLIRKSSWILDTMQDDSVDGIFVECRHEDPKKLHGDFYAIRPSVLRPDAFADIVQEAPRMGNHELTVAREFQPIIDKQRHRWLPDHDDSKGICRVRGKKSPVYHDHLFPNTMKNLKDPCPVLNNYTID